MSLARLMPNGRSPKLLFLITEDWFFSSHFLDRARAAKAAGFDVVVATRVREHGATIRDAGLRLIPIEFRRQGIGPAHELKVLGAINRIYREERPDIVHQIASKPILYGSLAARATGGISVVNAPVGMGYVFSSDDSRARLLRPLLGLGYRFLLNPPHSKVIFENREDAAAAVLGGTARESDVALIRGAGVNMSLFAPHETANTIPVIILVARMLRDKGVQEFVRAAEIVNANDLRARFQLVGDPDPANPASIPLGVLEGWNGCHGVEWLGRRDDVAALLALADIACLPSYREGLPKALIEAAAAGLPIVTTDTVGCREVVDPGVTGLLVPVKDEAALAEALMTLIGSPARRADMGRKGRAYALAEFASERIAEETIAVYKTLMLAHKTWR